MNRDIEVLMAEEAILFDRASSRTIVVSPGDIVILDRVSLEILKTKRRIIVYDDGEGGQ